MYGSLKKFFVVLVIFCFAINNVKAQRPIENTEEGVIPNIGVNQAPDEFDYEKYIKKVKKKIRENWKPTRKDETLNAKASFEIAPNGDLSKVELIRKSGDKEFDEEALKAIKKSAPFSKVPRPHHVNFSFNYNVIAITKSSEFAYKAYLKGVQKKIKKTWKELEDPLEGYARLHFKINESGEIIEIAFIGGRGVDGFKEQVEKVLKTAAPFGSLPAPVIIKFSFDYN